MSEPTALERLDRLDRLERLEQIARLIDHTLLRPEATPAEIERLCDEALEWGFGAVCVAPSYVTLARHRLEGSTAVVASVAGFPLGSTLSAVKAEEAAAAFTRGANEVDMVIHVGMARAGDFAYVERDIAAVVARRPPRGLIKVILETALLDDGQKTEAALCARRAGADFVKTSTGFGPGGATVADVALLRAAVGDALGVKAAGGIRDLATLRAMVGAGATRIGTSAGVAILAEAAQA